MKIAICMSGHMRTWKKCYDNLKKYILSNYDADIFISTWSTLENHYDGNIDDKNFVEFDEIQKLYGSNLKKCEIENYVDIYPHLNEQALKINSNIGPGCQPIRCISMLYKNFKVINMVNDDYDVIIKTRPDIIYSTHLKFDDISMINIPVDQPHNNGKIYNDDINYFIGSTNDALGGYTDIVLYSNKKNMIYYSNLYNEYYKYWTQGCPLHPELLLKFHLGDVKRTDFRAEILRKNNKEDGTYIHNINNPRVYY